MNLQATSPETVTDRLMRALECPHIRMLGHPTGRQLLNRDPYPFDFELIATEAARRKVYLEINSSPERLDLTGVSPHPREGERVRKFCHQLTDAPPQAISSPTCEYASG